MKHSCNFEEEGKVYMVRCEKCDKENYAPAVATGMCAWCGYDANKHLNETN